MNELYLVKLISLVKQEIIAIEQIKDLTYKLEVEKRLSTSN